MRIQGKENIFSSFSFLFFFLSFASTWPLPSGSTDIHIQCNAQITNTVRICYIWQYVWSRDTWGVAVRHRRATIWHWDSFANRAPPLFLISVPKRRLCQKRCITLMKRNTWWLPRLLSQQLKINTVHPPHGNSKLPSSECLLRKDLAALHILPLWIEPLIFTNLCCLICDKPSPSARSEGRTRVCMSCKKKTQGSCRRTGGCCWRVITNLWGIDDFFILSVHN